MYTKYLSESKEVDVKYFDFAKAFDKVDQRIQLHKLKDFGVRGKMAYHKVQFLDLCCS